MRNLINMTLPPEALFLNPWREPGMQLLLEPDVIWQPITGANIQGFAVSQYGRVNQKLRSLIKHRQKHETFDKAVEYGVVPVVLEEAGFRKSNLLAQGRVLLNGSSGIRAINRFRKENSQSSFDPDKVLFDYFQRKRDENAQREIPLYTGLLDSGLPFAVPCRNTFNFYHFISESLSQLTVLDGLDFQGDIYFHYPNPEDKRQTFCAAFVEALFPEFEGRVHFERVPKDYDRVLTAFDLLGAAGQAPEAMFEGLDQLASDRMTRMGGASNPELNSIFAMNGCTSTLRALRDRALRAIEGQDFSYLPKRVYFGRDESKSRARPMAGEETLLEHLGLFGFSHVTFENLAPLEQIALMAQAEMVIGYHGAGFTNMLWANPQTVVIELGTLQTAQIRWGDFWPHAHAAGCTYVNFFCDMDSDTPLAEPNFKKDGLVPVDLSERALAQVMAFVVTMLGHLPDLQSADMLSDLAQQVLQAGASEQAVALLVAHKDLVSRHSDLCLLLADAHKNLDQPKDELLALDRAFKADPKRWQTLVRIIWCANRCERPQVIRWALSRLQLHFPDRHAAFVGNHEWVRHVA
ncbi:MAG: glycosyltransferase family 61 protein [Sulfitobacter sp.]|nr:glycosyltransferase family 61 protein [Sulfitobacter sp.]